jgi:hypothetical protein
VSQRNTRCRRAPSTRGRCHWRRPADRPPDGGMVRPIVRCYGGKPLGLAYSRVSFRSSCSCGRQVIVGRVRVLVQSLVRLVLIRVAHSGGGDRQGDRRDASARVCDGIHARHKTRPDDRRPGGIARTQMTPPQDKPPAAGKLGHGRLIGGAGAWARPTFATRLPKSFHTAPASPRPTRPHPEKSPVCRQFVRAL